MIETVSTTYVKENCVCYERQLRENAPITSIKIVPNENYVLKKTYENESGEIEILYISGWVLLAIGNIANSFPQYEAILLTEVPEGEFISGITDPTETI